MTTRASLILPVILAMLAPSLSKADTALVAAIENKAGFSETVIHDIEAAIVAELQAEPGMTARTHTEVHQAAAACNESGKAEEAVATCLKAVGGKLGVDLFVITRLTTGPGGAWLSLKIIGIAEAKIIGRSRIKQVTPEDAAARAREAVAEARGRRAELAPETGAEAGTPGTTVVDGVALKPAGNVVRSDSGTLKPAGQVLQPGREVLEVAPGTGGTPTRPAGAVLEPDPTEMKPAGGSVIEPDPGEMKPAGGSVIEPQGETLPAPDDGTGRRWPGPAAAGQAPAGAESTSTNDLEWYSGWAALGVGVALGGTAIAFANGLRDEEGDERDSQLLAAQVTGGLAVAAAVTGVVLLLLSIEEEPPATAGVVPVHGGAAIGLSGRF